MENNNKRIYEELHILLMIYPMRVAKFDFENDPAHNY